MAPSMWSIATLSENFTVPIHCRGCKPFFPPGGDPYLSTPVFWNNAVYAAPGNGALMAFPMTGGILASSPSGSQSPETLGPQGATPVVSANGTNNALIWLIDTSGAGAMLRAFDPNNLSNELYNSGMLPTR